jgi:hypothetical protein
MGWMTFEIYCRWTNFNCVYRCSGLNIKTNFLLYGASSQRNRVWGPGLLHLQLGEGSGLNRWSWSTAAAALLSALAYLDYLAWAMPPRCCPHWRRRWRSFMLCMHLPSQVLLRDSHSSACRLTHQIIRWELRTSVTTHTHPLNFILLWMEVRDRTHSPMVRRRNIARPLTRGTRPACQRPWGGPGREKYQADCCDN